MLSIEDGSKRILLVQGSGREVLRYVERSQVGQAVSKRGREQSGKRQEENVSPSRFLYVLAAADHDRPGIHRVIFEMAGYMPRSYKWLTTRDSRNDSEIGWAFRIVLVNVEA